MITESAYRALDENMSQIEKLICEEMGISMRREGYTEKLRKEINDIYNTTPEKDTTTVYDWFKIAVEENPMLTLRRYYGTCLRFIFQYAAIDIEVNAFIIKVPNAKWVSEHAWLFVNGDNEKIGRMFGKIYGELIDMGKIAADI